MPKERMVKPSPATKGSHPAGVPRQQLPACRSRPDVITLTEIIFQIQYNIGSEQLDHRDRCRVMEEA
jgi:hypothetical protein